MTIETPTVGACSNRKLRAVIEWIKVYIFPTAFGLVMNNDTNLIQMEGRLASQ